MLQGHDHTLNTTFHVRNTIDTTEPRQHVLYIRVKWPLRIETVTQLKQEAHTTPQLLQPTNPARQCLAQNSTSTATQLGYCNSLVPLNLMSADELQKDAEAANALSSFLAIRTIPNITAESADLLVICGSSVLATVYVAVQALQQGTVPKLLISGGYGHSTVHLYNSISRHPIWHAIDTTEGRYEAGVLQDVCLALGVQQELMLPLEVESRNCGGNASCSKELVDKLGLQVEKVIVVQDPTMQLRTHACFTKWWSDLQPSNILSFSSLQPKLTVNSDGTGLAFVPETVTMKPPIAPDQLQQWQAAPKQRTDICGDKAAGGDIDRNVGQWVSNATGPAAASDNLSASQGVWDVDRFISLLLGEIPRLRDAPGGYGPKGQGFIDHVDVPQCIEDAWAWLAQRYPQLLRA